MASSIEFYFAYFTKHNSVVLLYVDATWLNTSVYYVAVMKSTQAFRNITQIFHTLSIGWSHWVENNRF